MIRAGEVDIEEKPNEIAVIEVADAVIHPGTMMIHAQDTPFTLFTVVSPGGLGFLTESTISRLSGELLDFITIFRRVRFPIIRYAAWVRGYS